MIQNKMFRKGLVLGMLVLFVGASFIPPISGNISKNCNVSPSQKDLEENSIFNDKNIYNKK